MDQFYSYLMHLWTSFTSKASITPSSDSYQPQLKIPDEHPNYVDSEAFSDNVANGDTQIRYVDPNGSYSWRQQAERPLYSYDQTDDGPMDLNNTERLVYGMTAHHHPKYIPQMNPGSWDAQENIKHITDESLRTDEQLTEANLPQKPPTIPESNTEEKINSATMKQESPNPVKCETEVPEPKLSKKLSTSKLPLEERNFPIETDSPKFVCPSCNSMFILHRQLIQHYVAYHAGPFNHRCPICNAGFHQWEDLKKHKQFHDPENKLTACEYCPQTFSYRRNMVSHLKLIHGIKPHKCQYCEERFDRADIMKTHEKQHM